MADGTINEWISYEPVCSAFDLEFDNSILTDVHQTSTYSNNYHNHTDMLTTTTAPVTTLSQACPVTVQAVDATTGNTWTSGQFTEQDIPNLRDYLDTLDTIDATEIRGLDPAQSSPVYTISPAYTDNQATTSNVEYVTLVTEEASTTDPTPENLPTVLDTLAIPTQTSQYIPSTNGDYLTLYNMTTSPAHVTALTSPAPDFNNKIPGDFTPATPCTAMDTGEDSSGSASPSWSPSTCPTSGDILWGQSSSTSTRQGDYDISYTGNKNTANKQDIMKTIKTIAKTRNHRGPKQTPLVQLPSENWKNIVRCRDYRKSKKDTLNKEEQELADLTEKHTELKRKEEKMRSLVDKFQNEYIKLISNGKDRKSVV